MPSLSQIGISCPEGAPPAQARRLAASIRRVAGAALLAFLCFAPEGAQAQPAPAQRAIPLEGLLVTAFRWAAPQWAASSHATVIEGEALERSGTDFLSDALRGSSGLAVAPTGSWGGATSLFMRGGESDYVKVMLDGVELNRPGGSLDLAGITTRNVERIEIVRGPQLYGSEAVGGVIQIFTKRGRGRPELSLFQSVGNYGSVSSEAAASGGTDRFSYAVSLSRSDTDGVLADTVRALGLSPEGNNAFTQTTFTGRLSGALGNAALASVSLRYSDRTFEYPTDGSGMITDGNAFSFGDDFSIRAELDRSWGDQAETVVGWTVQSFGGGIEDAPDGPADTLGFFAYRTLDRGSRIRGDARTTFRPWEAGWATLGVETGRQSMMQMSLSSFSWGASPGHSSHEQWNHAAYSELGLLTNAAALSVGGRLERDDIFGAAFTWKAGAAWRSLEERLRFRASMGTGIKEPTFFESYATGFARGNPNLEPEHSLSIEGGADLSELRLGELAQIGISATLFHHDYRDLIQYTSSPPTAAAPNYYNVAAARSRGIEVESELAIGVARLSGAYTYLDTEVFDSGFDEGPHANFAQGEELLRRPRHVVSGAASVAVSDASLRVDILRKGERADRDFSAWPAQRTTLPAYTTVDASAAWTWRRGGSSPGFTVSVRTRNLLSAYYEEALGFPAPGRSIAVGGRLLMGG